MAQEERKDDFIPVKSRKKRKNRGPKATTPLPELLDRVGSEFGSDVYLNIEAHIRRMMAPLEAPCTSAVCLGLGSPTDSRNSRAQLWLLLEICKSLNIPRHSIKLYDPAFSEQDIADLSDLGLSIVSENLHGKYIAITPTFFYLPHCGLAIYENLIRSNWQAGLVRHLRLLANEFLNYVESIPGSAMQAKYPCLHRLTQHLTSHTLQVPESYASAFNTTAIQYWDDSHPVPEEDDSEFWSLPPSQFEDGNEWG